MKTLILILLLLCVLACQRTQTIWVRPDMTLQDYQKDHYECLYQVQMLDAIYAVSENNALLRAVRVRQNFNSCMYSRGYYQKEIPRD